MSTAAGTPTTDAMKEALTCPLVGGKWKLILDTKEIKDFKKKNCWLGSQPWLEFPDTVS